jgi:hypothetical protein
MKSESMANEMQRYSKRTNSDVYSFSACRTFPEDGHHFVSFEVYHTVPQGFDVWPNFIPTVVMLLECHDAKDYKRVDYYGFETGSLVCAYHTSCETKPKVPLQHSHNYDRDVSKLLDYGGLIAEMLQADLPKEIDNLEVVKSLKSRTLKA